MENILKANELVDWIKFKTAYGTAEKIFDQLKALATGNEEVKLEASHKLWCALCHQHAYVSSAAKPALPILFSIFNNVSELVQVEIMDIFLEFTVCTSPDHPESDGEFQKISELYSFQRNYYLKICILTKTKIYHFSQKLFYNY